MLLINNEVLFGQKEEAIVLFAVEWMDPESW